MQIISRFFFTLLFVLTLASCQQQVAEHHHSSLHFGTLIDITLYDVSEEQAAQAFKKLDEDFAYLHAAWSPWEAGSLRRTNSLITTGRTFSAGPSILPLIEQSTELAIKTDHLFNPAIGGLINLWQFHLHDEPGIEPPSNSQITNLLKSNPRMTDLVRDGIKMHSKNNIVSLNFGAFAKGYAIDLEIQQLKSMGIYNAIINTGGDLKTIGSKGDRAWQIAIQHPRRDTWLATIKTESEESVFTSGDYQRYYMHNKKRYHHILDPRTGYPALGTQSVTVLHTNSGLADAAATALFVAGPEQWLDIAKRLEISQAMLVDDKGVAHVTPEMHKRLTFNPEIDTTIIITPAL